MGMKFEDNARAQLGKAVFMDSWGDGWGSNPRPPESQSEKPKNIEQSATYKSN
jgi:hypothetical protein